MTEPNETEELENNSSVGMTTFSGLHAKFFIVEKGWDTSVFTGSANFSDAALSGRNVEFMVELLGKKSRLGINGFLGGENEQNSFRAMLRKYDRSQTLKKDHSKEQELEKILEETRKTIAGGGLKAMVFPAEGDLFEMAIVVASEFRSKLNAVSGNFYPISLKPTSGKPLKELQNSEPVKFGPITPYALTGFFAFEITARIEDKSSTIAFVLNLPVENMPEDRDNKLLHYLISDQKSFIRYLLFILMDENERILASDLIHSNNSDEEGKYFTHSFLGFQLLEELVRAYSRNPEKIDRIAKLAKDLCQTPQGRSLFPQGFEEVWDAFLEARGLKEAAQ